MQLMANFPLTLLMSSRKAGWRLSKQRLLIRKWKWSMQNFHFTFRKQNWLVMKLTAILLLSACLQVSATGFSQNITLAEKNVSLQKLFKQIHKQTGYQFFYEDEMLNKAGRINIDVKDASLEKVLAICFKDLPLSYSIANNAITVTPKNVDVVLQPQLPAINNIHGTVKDQKGDPLAGVSVIVKGTAKGTSTGTDGSFSIDANVGDVLKFSIVGYREKSVTVGQNNNISVVMEIEAEVGNEIVVVAYGTEKKADLTGSVASVSSKQIENRPITNITNALEGTVAGVTVVQNNGQPGRDAGTINIRGIGTLNNSNPMVVVDGMISTMNDVNPNDIASISVLKDAASAAIYGSRAANGVIIITTKKGEKGAIRVNYSTYLGKQKPTALPDYLPSWQAATMYNEGLVNEGKTPAYTAQDIALFKNGTDPYNHPNTDWLGLFYKGSGIQENQYVNVSGGTDKTQYMFSFGYLNQEGNVKKTNAEHYTFRMNINTEVSKRISAFANISYSYEPFEEPASSYPGVPGFSQVLRQINRISPTIPYKYANGNYGYISDGSPMAWLESSSFNKMNPYRFRGNIGADLEIVKGLHFTPSFSYQLQTDYNKQFIADIQYYDPVSGLPSFNQGPSRVTDHYDNAPVVTLQGLLNYTKSVGNHNFKILGGYSQEYDGYNQLEGYRQNFLNNSLSDLDAASTSGQTSEGYSTEVAWQSFFGRVNYDYKGKYLIEGNLRYDGSSRFDTANRWGVFPSVSAGWRVSEEGFFSPLKDVISNLKIRGSWGKLGNAQIGGNELASDYGYITTVSSGQNYIFGGASPAIAAGIAPVYGANTNLKWETTTESDIGLDAGFFQNKISLTADYFVRNTSNILLSVPVGAPYGLVAPTQNAGAVQNKGVELALGYKNKKGNFSYGVTGNVSFIHNEVTSLDNTSPIISGGTIIKVGLPINAFYGYESQGLFQTSEELAGHATQSGGVIAPGDIMYKDISGPDGKPDGVIDGNDRTYLGASFPKVAFGLNIVLGWKGIDFTAFLEGKAGVKNYVQGIMLGQLSQGAGKPTSAMLNAWTPTNTNASFPRLWVDYTQNDPSENPSSYWLRNASYLRFKNLQIGYTLPQSMTHHIGIQRARIYYSGQNIFTVTQFYKWVDPETVVGNNGYYYPQVKVNTIGINITF